MPNFLAVAGPGSKYNLPGATAAGFWAGLWHGLIVDITFLVSLVTTDVRIYEPKNNGRWYDFGFLLGVGLAWGGSGYRAGA